MNILVKNDKFFYLFMSGLSSSLNFTLLSIVSVARRAAAHTPHHRASFRFFGFFDLFQAEKAGITQVIIQIQKNVFCQKKYQPVSIL